MSERINSRITAIEKRQGRKDSIIVARHGYIEPEPGQVVVGNGYWASEWPPKTKKTKHERSFENE